MPRAILCILDSVGIGGAPDADAYGDTGSNTFGHSAEWAATGKVTQKIPADFPSDGEVKSRE